MSLMSSLHHAAVRAGSQSSSLLYPADFELLTTDEGFAQQHAERYLKTAQEYLEFTDRENARATATEGLKLANMFPGHLPGKIQLQKFLRDMDAPFGSSDGSPSFAVSLNDPNVLPLPHFERRDRR